MSIDRFAYFRVILSIDRFAYFRGATGRTPNFLGWQSGYKYTLRFVGGVYRSFRIYMNRDTYLLLPHADHGRHLLPYTSVNNGFGNRIDQVFTMQAVENNLTENSRVVLVDMPWAMMRQFIKYFEPMKIPPGGAAAPYFYVTIIGNMAASEAQYNRHVFPFNTRVTHSVKLDDSAEWSEETRAHLLKHVYDFNLLFTPTETSSIDSALLHLAERDQMYRCLMKTPSEVPHRPEECFKPGKLTISDVADNKHVYDTFELYAADLSSQCGKPVCPDCKGTGKYIGLTRTNTCPTCKGN